jgi:hypothetical protein
MLAPFPNKTSVTSTWPLELDIIKAVALLHWVTRSRIISGKYLILKNIIHLLLVRRLRIERQPLVLGVPSHCPALPFWTPAVAVGPGPFSSRPLYALTVLALYFRLWYNYKNEKWVLSHAENTLNKKSRRLLWASKTQGTLYSPARSICTSTSTVYVSDKRYLRYAQIPCLLINNAIRRKLTIIHAISQVRD